MTGKANAAPDWDRLGFAFTETDFLYQSFGEVDREPVWDSGRLRPFGDVAFSPAASFLSYGLGIFEGLKARRAADGRVLLFRPRDNARRFGRSAEALMMKPFPEDRFVAAVEEVVRSNLRFVPPHGRGALYLRPLQHAIEPRVGARPGTRFWVLLFGCPVGDYFAGHPDDPAATGLRLRVLDQSRCAAGGTGSAKAIGNYAAGLAVSYPWRQRGFDDVLYLDARRFRDLTETSGSNVFVKLKGGALVTPSLDDQILPGITRDAAIRIARDVLGVQVEERPISLEETLDDAEEMFCTGTAWSVVAVRELDHDGRRRLLPGTGLQQAIRDELLGIQLGEREDRFGWVSEVDRHG